MKRLVIKVLEAMLIILLTILLGMFVPFIVAFIVFLSTEFSLGECMSNVPFWLFTTILTFISSVYINEIINKNI